MQFYLQLDKLKHISPEELERLKWLPVTYIFKKCVNAIRDGPFWGCSRMWDRGQKGPQLLINCNISYNDET